MYKYILLGWMAFSSLTFYTLNYVKDGVIEEVTAAAQAHDVAGLASRVQWDDLRANLKISIAEQKKQLKQYNANIGPADEKIAPVVDYYAQPENLAILYYYHGLMFADVPVKDFIDSTSYYPPFGFQITLGYPKNRPVSDPSLALVKDRIKVRLVFGLDGLTWKIKELQVPVFFVPQQTYDQSALTLFGPP